ncbi:MAG: class II fructose-bisphosphate aldolase [Clostridia bacterium]
MPLATMKQMLIDAREEHSAIGAFMTWDYATAQATVTAAEKVGRPVILLLGDRDAAANGGFRFYSEMLRNIAEHAKVPVALHADHFGSYDNIVQAIAGGYSSVMVDASKYPIEQNIAMTREVVRVAHACGVSVEAELGRLPGNEGDEDVTVADAFQTDPDDAVRFVEETGIDCLAISIGTAHGTYTAAPVINMERIREIRSRVDVPLVMHGGSGTPEPTIVEAIRCGISKINVATDMVTVLANTIWDLRGKPGLRYKIGEIFTPAYEALEAMVEDRIRLFTCLKNV